VLARPILFRVGPYFGLLFSGRARAGPKSPAHIPSTNLELDPHLGLVEMLDLKMMVDLVHVEVLRIP
jgi:hypothetical protein